MRKPHLRQLLSLPAMGVLVAATATSLAAGPAAAGQGFGPHFVGPHTDAGNWGGYAVAGSSGQFKTIKGSWKEPVAKCKTTSDLAAPWIGIDGYGDETVEQTGAAVSCASGSPKYKAWYEMYPRAPHYYSKPVSAGDIFKASVTHESGTSYKLTISDTTKGWTKTVTQSLSAQDATAEAILEGPGGYPGFPDGVKFISVTVNGKSFKTFGPSKLTSGGFVPGPMNSAGGFTLKS